MSALLVTIVEVLERRVVKPPLLIAYDQVA